MAGTAWAALHPVHLPAPVADAVAVTSLDQLLRVRETVAAAMAELDPK
jgi:hypothetical protein